MNLFPAAIIFYNICVLSNMVTYEFGNVDQNNKKDQIEQIKIPAGFRRGLQFIALVVLNATAFQVKPFMMYNSELAILAGLLISALGVALLIYAKATLAECYSPCSNQRVPPRVIDVGPYKFIRHPIYMSNMMCVIGFFIAFGSIPAFMVFAYLLKTYQKSVVVEEKVIAANHPEYLSLMSQTGMFFPNVKALVRKAK